MKYGSQPSVKYLHAYHKSGTRKNLTEGNIVVKLLTFALPIIFTNLLQRAYNLADSIIVGRFVNEFALAGVGANNSISNFLLCLFMGLSAGGGVVIANYYGAKQYDDVRTAVHNMIIISIICGLAMTVIGYLLARPILLLINCPPEVIGYSTDYLRIYFLGVLAVLFYNMGSSILRAIGNSVAPLIYLIVCAIVNVGLDLWFVADLGWGIKGAAWATVISQALSALLVLFTLLFTNSAVKLNYKYLRVNKDMVVKIVKKGVPVGLQSGMFSFANMILQANLGAFEPAVMAGWVAANKLDNIAYAPIQSFGIAVNTFTGQNVGAKQYTRVKKGVFITAAMSLITAIVVITPMLIFRRELVSIFTDNPRVIDFGVKAVLYIMPFYSIFGLSEVLSGTLRGAGKTGTSASIAAVGILGVRILWLYIIVKIWPSVDTLFFVHPVSWLTNFLLFLIFYLVKGWSGVLNVSKEEIAASAVQPASNQNQQNTTLD